MAENDGLNPPMRLIDAHCHLESDAFQGRLEAILDDARAVGIVKLITASIVPDQWPVSTALARQFPSVECAWGIHPWYIRTEFEADLPRLAEAPTQGAVAIGEIGLDTKFDRVPFELQQTFFERQLAVAKEINLPVVLHCRGAFNELIQSIHRIGLPERGGILHNFSGSPELAQQLGPMGLSFSLGGTLTYRNSRKKREVLHAIYPQWFLLETDSPDISPVEAPERPNVPANILYSLRAAAEVLGDPEDVIAEHTTQNALRIFGLTL